MPPEPAPCGATALKPLLMACDHWQRGGVLADLDVSLVLPRSSPIGVTSADDRLEAILTSYGVDVLRSAQVTAVGDRRLTVSTPDGDHELDDLAYAHVVPHYRAPAWIAESGLAGATGQGGGRTAEVVRRLHGHAHHDVAAPTDLLPQDPAREGVGQSSLGMTIHPMM